MNVTVKENPALTTVEQTALRAFIHRRDESATLIQLMSKRYSNAPVLFRGTQYRKKELEVGNIYEHWNRLSSWSIQEDVAIQFATDSYVPEDLLEEVVEELGYDTSELNHESDVWDEVYAEFTNVLFVVTDAKGFSINDHYQHPTFEKENEVIVDLGRWMMLSMSEEKTSSGTEYTRVVLTEA